MVVKSTANFHPYIFYGFNGVKYLFTSKIFISTADKYEKFYQQVSFINF